ncbi:MAG: BamA/TamA family outer membrane protein [Marinibacterium sp.]|nr:BamA/TamA family outer membrane protein [Marinibacterium sp.]
MSLPAWAADDLVTDEISDIDDLHTRDLGFGNGSVIVAPIPFSNPTIGSGLTLGAGYLFKLDEGSKTSHIGLAALRSDNDSEAYGANLALSWGAGRWTLSSFAGIADLRYDLFVDDVPLPLKQSGDIAQVMLSREIGDDASLGLSLRYLDTAIAPDADFELPDFLQDLFSLQILNVGLIGDWDTRDDDIYATRGQRLRTEIQRGLVLQGLVDDFTKGKSTYDVYSPVGENGVLAGRLAVCAADDHAPFYELCSLGGSDQFRGFGSTQYLDGRLASAQVEYRHRFGKRLGGVAFAGLGSTGAEFNELSAPHYAAGVGLRYRLSQKFPLDFSIDGTVNDEDDQQLYIYVGQRF